MIGMHDDRNVKSARAERNLVIVWQPRWQELLDCEEIAERITAAAPDVAVVIANNESYAAVARKKAGRRPSLIVSLAPLRRFKPVRGRVYQGTFISKTDQKARLAAAGLPVPKGAVLEPGLELDPDVWGPFVILKPLDRELSHSGRGVSLRRTENVRYRPPEDYPHDHPGRAGPMLVEQFIDTGEHPAYYRVLTLFGEPLSVIHHATLKRRPPLTVSDEDLAVAPINVSQGYVRMKFVEDPDLLELGRRIYPAVAEVPFHACDIVRDVHTGALHVLELNPGQNAWRISSDYWRRKRKALGGRRAMIDQFGAWDLAARVLIERTRAEAE